jgi:hypothetical protein
MLEYAREHGYLRSGAPAKMRSDPSAIGAEDDRKKPRRAEYRRKTGS